MDELAGLEPLPGGHSGETFLSHDGRRRVVVRILGGRSASRGPDAVAVDAAVLGLMRGIVPVPDVVEARRARPDLDEPGLLVTTFLPGVRVDEVLPALDDVGLRRLGANVGAIIDRLTHVPTPRPGLFVDASLVPAPPPREYADLVDFLESRRPSFADWSASQIDALLEVADEAQGRLDVVDRSCLVHSDLNPKNLLADPTTLEITGVVDWEFAHSGSPYTDLGNVLRFDRAPAYVEGVLAACQAGLGEDALDLARRADLFALVDLAARRTVEPNPVTEAADALLRAIAATRDVHAR